MSDKSLDKMSSFPRSYFIVISLAFACIICLAIFGPVSQDQKYHHFADRRKLLGIPNFFNVITNLPFACVGLLGLYGIFKIKSKKLQRICTAIYAGFLLLTFGSGYYHLYPSNETLVFDRIPIVVIVVSFFAFVIYDRIDIVKGYRAFFVLNLLGITSVLYWIISEHIGKGDLRWYAMMQFYPVIAIPLILLQDKSPCIRIKEIVPIFLYFGLARFSEAFDYSIYSFLGGTISGHSLKHLLMTAAGCEIVILLRRRIEINTSSIE